MRDRPGNCSQHSVVEKSRPAPLKCSSFPLEVMVTLPPGAPPPLGVGPQGLPHSPMIQSERMGVALQRPASVGESARAEPVTAHSKNAIRNFNSGNRRIADFEPTRSNVVDAWDTQRSAGASRVASRAARRLALCGVRPSVWRRPNRVSFWAFRGGLTLTWQFPGCYGRSSLKL